MIDSHVEYFHCICRAIVGALYDPNFLSTVS